MGVSQTGINTNNVEGIFGCLNTFLINISFKYTSVEELDNSLSEFVFRYTYEGFKRKTVFQRSYSSFAKIIKLNYPKCFQNPLKRVQLRFLFKVSYSLYNQYLNTMSNKYFN